MIPFYVAIKSCERRLEMNVLLIMVDQLRADYLGYAGADFVNTPNIDALASGGRIFHRCYTNSPICAPARISLATGQRPWRLGALDNDVALPIDVPTYYKTLRDHGYHVGCVGKLDLNKPNKINGFRGTRPCLYSYGFTQPFEIEGKMHAANSPKPRGPYTYYLEQKGLLQTFHEHRKDVQQKGFIENLTASSSVPAEDFADVYVGEKAVETLHNLDKEYPWHLFVSFPGPHDPFDPPEIYSDSYANKEMPKAHSWNEKKASWVHGRQKSVSSEELQKMRQQYCAYIELIDQQIGKIIKTLKDRGDYHNTLVLFTSDHGDMLGDFDLHNKHVPYESAIHIPLLVSGPTITSGESHALIELADIHATILDILDIQPDYKMDATSFKPVLYESKEEHRPWIVAEERHFRCIRDHEYKFIDNYNDDCELYNLLDDPYELKNIADNNPTLVKTYRNHLQGLYSL